LVSAISSHIREKLIYLERNYFQWENRADRKYTYLNIQNMTKCRRKVHRPVNGIIKCYNINDKWRQTGP
jgi:hypothetical protein